MSRRSTRMGNASSRMLSKQASSKEDDMDPAASTLQTAYSKFHFQCRSCKAPFSHLDLSKNLDTWLDSEPDAGDPAFRLSVLSCKKCQSSTCVGCGCQPSKNKSITKTVLGPLSNCCENGRLLGIWHTLCQFDDEVLEQLRAYESKAKQPRPPKATQDSGVGYALGYKLNYAKSKRESDALTRKHDGEKDDSVTLTLILLTGLLPAVGSISPPTSTQDE